MARPDLNGGRRRLGYFAAIIVSALVHAGLIALLLFVLPGLLVPNRVTPPSYTVKIVDNLPAGDLGTHLPPLASRKLIRKQEKPQEQPKSQILPPREPDDPHALALNVKTKPTPTRTPRPTPAPTATARPHTRRTPRPTPRHRMRPTPTPTPVARRRHDQRPRKAQPKPSIMIAKAEPTPSMRDELRRIHDQLEQQSKKLRHSRSNPEGESGPVEASRNLGGSGYGVGKDAGSMGIQNDPEFLLYYQTLQERIKAAWSFPGSNRDLITTALFAIDANGNLMGVKVVDSSHNESFDDSVIRAIRRAGPFPPPPGKYRNQFAQGVKAVFKLGDLQS
ncbi:MAG: TonB family protein [Candidatus Binataceae bacterium]|nr:TonB family protein [Candidatus Binataceae bacterium]